MANYSVLKAAVQAVVKTNGNQEITGANMQSTLISIINSLGTGYQFMGVATPSTSPGTPDYNVAYIGGAGTYANFGTSVTVPVGSIGVFKYNGSWTQELVSDGLINNVTILENNVTILKNKIDGEKYTEVINVTAGEAIGVNIDRPLSAGEKFYVKATGDNIGTQVVLYADSINTEIGRVSINGDEVEMTSPINATKIIIFRASAYVTASGTITVIISFFNSISLDVDTLKSDVDTLNEQINGVSLSGSYNSAGSQYYDFAFYSGEPVVLKNTSISGSLNAFTNNGSTDIETIKQGLNYGESVSFVPNSDAAKLRIYYSSSSGGSFTITSDSISKQIEDLNYNVFGETGKLEFAENSNYYYEYKNVGTTVTSEAQLLVSASGKYKAISLSEYAGKQLKFNISKNGTSQSGRGILLVSNNIVVDSWREADIINQDIVIDIPVNSILYESHGTDSTISVGIVINEGCIDKISALDNTAKSIRECFVSTNGDDNNSGSESAPFATIGHAINEGFKNICVSAGVYNERISIINSDNIRIYANNKDTYSGNKRSRPIFSNGKSYVSFQTGTGYKYFALSDVPNTYTSVFINHTIEPIITYQSFPNTYTVGLWATCTNKFDDFMFKPVLSLSELSENNTFYYDGTNVYFNTNAAINSVVVVGDITCVLTLSGCNGVQIAGICFEYGYNDTAFIEKCNNVVVSNCEFSHSLMRNNVDYSQSDINVINCESYKARRDGFNAAYYGVAYLENCNSRYNYDDGESSHEYCEVEILGGEYSYNGKAGHAPVNGCKFKCNGTYSHHNAQYGLMRPSLGDYVTEPYLISNSVFIDNRSYDIATDLDVNLMNCKYVTSTGTGNINDLTQ